MADYYPFGKILREWVACDQERYLTTYHERDKESGYDYRGARFYDSDLGRFLSVDPLAKKYPAWSTYTYVADNPVIFVDPDGKDFINVHTARKEKAYQELQDEQVAFNSKWDGINPDDLKGKEKRAYNRDLASVSLSQEIYDNEVMFASLVDKILAEFKSVNIEVFSYWDKRFIVNGSEVDIIVSAQNTEDNANEYARINYTDKIKK